LTSVISSSPSSSTPADGSTARRYGICGVGWRASMYVDAMISTYRDVAVPVAWCDTNEVRMRHYDVKVGQAGHRPRHYAPDQLARMLEQERIDVLVVCSPDHTHAHAVSTALRAGVDVVCEKPLTIDAAGLRQIQEAVDASAASLTVTFNYRYSPRNSALRQVIADGTLGQVHSVHFEWLLDTVHGADYFRRWHRDKANSGGLAVHKATHHFDLVNWWIGDIPEVVYALGGLRFYGDHGTGRPAGDRPALGREAAADDPFGFDLSRDDNLRGLYLHAEGEDGYLRDRDVFDAGISTEDTLSVLVGYRGGANMTYSLTAYSPWEGYRVSVNGSRGRAELEVVERAHVARGETSDLRRWDEEKRPAVDPSLAPETGGTALGIRPYGSRLVVQQQWEEAREVPIDNSAGGHGGGDELLLADVFTGAGEDPLRRKATYVDGLRSVAVGVGINESLTTRSPFLVSALGLRLE
jgi:predicted dehydrogenase